MRTSIRQSWLVLPFCQAWHRVGIRKVLRKLHVPDPLKMVVDVVRVAWRFGDSHLEPRIRATNRLQRNGTPVQITFL